MSFSVQANDDHHSIAPDAMYLDLDASHSVLGGVMDVLLRNFKEDTNYRRPLMSPQANVVFALDKQAAKEMADYMSDKLCEVAGFTREEFRFVCKSGMNGEVLQRLRLEFSDGVNLKVIRKMLIAKDKLSRTLPPVTALQPGVQF